MDNLDKIIKQVTADAEGDDGVFRAFLQTVKNHVKLPAEGFVVGEPVSVTALDYDGNERRGLTARCRREDGSLHLIALAEVLFPKTLEGLWHITAYRKWLGLEPFPDQGLQRRPHKATADDLDLSKPVELVALSVKGQTARCRLPASDRIITLRASGVYDLIPGEIITVKPKKQWRYGGHPYLSGEIQSTRIDPKALGLVPLGLVNNGIWAISYLNAVQNMPFDTMKPAWASESSPWEESLEMFCCGAILTTARFSAACMAMACACGAWAVLRRQKRFSFGCSG